MADQSLLRAKGREAELLSAAKIALRELKGTNIMGGCSACGTARRGEHKKNCIYQRLKTAIEQYKYV